MALSKQGLADAIKQATEGIASPTEAINALWRGICDYFEGNAEVSYSWTAFNPTGSPDPMTVWVGKIKTAGSLSLTNASTPELAMSTVSAMLNSQIATWTVEPPSGFSLTPMFIIPSVSLSPSNAADRDSALLKFAGMIIDGVIAATPSTSGSHSAFTGTGTFTSIS